MAALLALFSVPILLLPNETVVTILNPCIWYSIAYLSGQNFEKIALSGKRASAAAAITAFCFVLRIISRFYLDGSPLYDRFTVTYTNFVAAACIMYIYACIFNNIRPNKLARLIDDMSYEIYLWHPVFTFGSFSLFGKTPSWITDCIIAAAFTFITAFVMNKISNLILGVKK